MKRVTALQPAPEQKMARQGHGSNCDWHVEQCS